MVETGDITVGDKNRFKVLSVQKDKPICFSPPDDVDVDRLTPPVVHAAVYGESEDGPWSYEVF